MLGRSIEVSKIKLQAYEMSLRSAGTDWVVASVREVTAEGLRSALGLYI